MATAQDSSEEEDYMSEEFLKQCTSNDVRPSLLFNRADKRQVEVLRKQQEANKTKAEREQARLRSVEESMKIPIGQDNKGFQMLQKMGYKPGSSIGKEVTDPARKGITTPIEIELRQGRKGLGRERHEFEKQKKEITLGNPDEYRSRRQAEALAREVFLDLKRAQFACHNLDEEAGKGEPLEGWFWPKLKKKKEEEEEEEETEPDQVDARNVPVVPRKRARLDDDEQEELSDSEEEEEEEEVPNGKKLDLISGYLRKAYFYCLWCAVKYENSEDLAKCPGNLKDDHD